MSSSSDPATDSTQIEAVTNAAHNNRVDVLRAALAANPAIGSMAAPNGMTPLTAALYGRASEAVALLLAHNVRPTVFEAAALGDVIALEEWLAREPEQAQAYSFDGWTALHLAAHFGQAEAARVLLAYRADPRAVSQNGLENQPLHAACASPGNQEVGAVLLDSGADVNAREHGGFTPLHQAAQNGDAAMVELLLARGADRDARTDDGQTPQQMAEAIGDDPVMALLRGDAAAG